MFLELRLQTEELVELIRLRVQCGPGCTTTLGDEGLTWRSMLVPTGTVEPNAPRLAPSIRPHVVACEETPTALTVV